MSAFEHSRASLRFFGDDLVPDEISALLGASPTQSRVKGDIVGSHSGINHIAKVGSWRLHVVHREPKDLEGQILEILAQLTQDLSVWASLSRFQPDMFCGLFMSSSNDGTLLSEKALIALGERGISLALDVYDADDELSGAEQ